jgi:hypothetical protein
MEPDFFTRLRLITIPSWSKYFFFLMLIAIGLLNTAVFVYGVWSGKDTLVEVTLRLLAVLLPIFTIFYIIIYVRTGEASILRNVEFLFTNTVPHVLAQIEDEDFSFYSPAKAKLETRKARISILTNYRRGEIYADFMVLFKKDNRKILIRLETNYRRINFNLYLSLQTISHVLGRTDLSVSKIERDNANVTESVLRVLGHSLEGARYADDREYGEESQKIYQSGYIFNREMIFRRLEGSEYMCLVGMKSVGPNFISDPSERYYFAVDLMLMLRAMIAEYPAITVSHI